MAAAKFPEGLFRASAGCGGWRLDGHGPDGTRAIASEKGGGVDNKDTVFRGKRSEIIPSALTLTYYIMRPTAPEHCFRATSRAIVVPAPERLLTWRELVRRSRLDQRR